jgi:hypothetical protein
LIWKTDAGPWMSEIGEKPISFCVLHFGLVTPPPHRRSSLYIVGVSSFVRCVTCHGIKSDSRNSIT